MGLMRPHASGSAGGGGSRGSGYVAIDTRVYRSRECVATSTTLVSSRPVHRAVGTFCQGSSGPLVMLRPKAAGRSMSSVTREGPILGVHLLEEGPCARRVIKAHKRSRNVAIPGVRPSLVLQ